MVVVIEAAGNDAGNSWFGSYGAQLITGAATTRVEVPEADNPPVLVLEVAGGQPPGPGTYEVTSSTLGLRQMSSPVRCPSSPNPVSGTVVIDEASYDLSAVDPADRIVRLDARIQGRCGSGARFVAHVTRSASRPMSALVWPTLSGPLSDVRPDQESEFSFSVQNISTIPVAAGTVSLSDNGEGSFTVLTDGCSGRTLEVEGQCVVTLRHRSSVLGVNQGRLTVDNPLTDVVADSSHTVPLRVNVVDPVSPPQPPGPGEGLLVTELSRTQEGSDPFLFTTRRIIEAVDYGSGQLRLSGAGQSVAWSFPDGPPEVGVYPGSAALVFCGQTLGSGQLVIDDIVYQVVDGLHYVAALRARYWGECPNAPAPNSYAGQVTFNRAPFPSHEIVVPAFDALQAYEVQIQPLRIVNTSSVGLPVFAVRIRGGPFIIWDDTCSATVVAPGASCEVHIAAVAGGVDALLQGVVSVVDGFTGPSGDSDRRLQAVADADLTGFGEFRPVAPTRILDTRIGQGAEPGQVPGNSFIDVQISGVAGLPLRGVDSVVLNVTAVEPDGPGFVTAYPCCGDRPLASNLNFVASDTVPNLVIAQVGDGGRVRLWVNGSSAHLVADLAGWIVGFDSLMYGSRLVPGEPRRVADTRTSGADPIGHGRTLRVPVTFPGTAIAAVVNLTGIQPTAPTFISAYPSGTTRPLVSNLNLDAGEIRANLAVVPVGADGAIELYNNAGEVHLAVDLVGVFATNGDHVSAAGRLVTGVPERLFDSRDFPEGPFPPASYLVLDTSALEEDLGAQVAGLLLNVTATEATEPTFVSVLSRRPSSVPTTSTVNVMPGQTVPNLAIADTSSNVNVYYNNSGFTHVVSDLQAIVLGTWPALATGDAAVTVLGHFDASARLRPALGFNDDETLGILAYEEPG